MAGVNVRVPSGADEKALGPMLCNGFDCTEGPSVARHSRRMAAYQRAGIGLIYGDDGHWIADHLDGDERVRAQEQAYAAWSQTHCLCPQSARMHAPAPDCFVRYRCPECGENTSLHPNGKIVPHAVRIDHPSPVRGTSR